MEVVLDDASIDGTASLNYYASPLNVGDFRSFFTQTSKFFVCFSDFIDKNYVQNNIKLIKGNSNFNKIFYSILGINFGGSEELVLFAAFWFYFTGSSLAYRDDAHINADMTSLLFKSEKAKKRMAVVKYAVSMVIAIVATAWAFQFVSWSFELWPTTPIYKLPLALSRLSIIVSFILMSIYVLIHLIRSVAILKGGEN